jgi:hypothetical protein
MSSNRIQRLREYRQEKGPSGQSRDEKCLKYWSDRSEANSLVVNRPDRRPTTDKIMAKAKSDPNTVGSSYMRGVRRTAN